MTERVTELLEGCARLYEGKAATYSPSRDKYENFRYSAAYRNHRRPGRPPLDAVDTCLMLIGLKESRLATLARVQAAGGDTLYEGMTDTQRDRAVYEMILVALQEELAIMQACSDRDAAGARALAELSAGLEPDYEAIGLTESDDEP